MNKPLLPPKFEVKRVAKQTISSPTSKVARENRKKTLLKSLKYYFNLVNHANIYHNRTCLQRFVLMTLILRKKLYPEFVMESGMFLRITTTNLPVMKCCVRHWSFAPLGGCIAVQIACTPTRPGISLFNVSLKPTSST